MSATGGGWGKHEVQIYRTIRAERMMGRRAQDELHHLIKSATGGCPPVTRPHQCEDDELHQYCDVLASLKLLVTEKKFISVRA